MEIYNFICLLLILEVWKALAQQQCGGSSYAAETYTDLLNPGIERIISAYSVCLNLCTFNRSCAAVSYSRTTLKCAMSGEPSVVNYTEDDGEPLTLVKESHAKDMRVYKFSTLVARQGAVMSLSTKQSETYHLPGCAIDGVYKLTKILGNQTKNSMAHTRSELSPWIQADLKTLHYIYGVKIWNRSSSQLVMKRLANIRVTVGESDGNFDDPPEDEICKYLPGQPDPADIISLPCHRRTYGRYVRVTAVNVNKPLNIYELEIHGLLLLK